SVYVCAVRATYALAYYFHYIGRMSLPSMRLIPSQINSPVDDLNNSGPEDVLVAITFSPYSKETIEACRFASSRGTKLILISDSEIVAPELQPAEILVASTQSTHPFSCFSGGMIVLENLIALMVRNGGDEALRNLRSYENLRNEFSAYWKFPKSGS
ncbi:MAG: MurR/RpiR family transcriptional regulator, partial [Paracoccaceae bacterium]